MPDAAVTEHAIETNGVTLRVLDVGTGPAVLLSHGFPELGYSWRHQVGPLAAAGYRVIVPDQRGYGGSSRPDAIEDYDIVHLTDDLVGILDALGEEKAVMVGHDWGSFVVSHMAMMQPERTRALVNMSVPFTPRGQLSVVEMLKMVIPEDTFFYILYFQEVGPADADLAADPRETMTRLLCGVKVDAEGAASMVTSAPKKSEVKGFVDMMPPAPEVLPEWITQEEVDHYVAVFSETGFTGGINWYRNFHRNWEITPQLADVKVEAPAYFISGKQDPVIGGRDSGFDSPTLLDWRGETIIGGAGHWVQQEKPSETNTALINFLHDVHGK
ncbi:MAG TPA: alpha/beta hydrolase [Acidimicrobiales bacterium]|nr:alpha/beta hydrolase [Acidimicrobiales bacterium]